jgi:hypothetical protein
MLVIVANLAALSGVWFNRTGQPDAVVTLTERELPLMPRGDDDSGVALKLTWRSEDGGDSWLDRDKLDELGFDIPHSGIDRYISQYRKLFAVLEYREGCDEPEKLPCLYAIDAGRDSKQLRRSYADRARYIIAPAAVQLRYQLDRPDGEKLTGRVQRLLLPMIHVPAEHGTPFTGAGADLSYRVTLRYGRRHEPWILAVE